MSDLVLSDNAIWALKELADCVPTVNVKDMQVKGWYYDGEGCNKVYYKPADLRDIAKGLLEAADYLVARAKQDPGE